MDEARQIIVKRRRSSIGASMIVDGKIIRIESQCNILPNLFFCLDPVGGTEELIRRFQVHRKLLLRADIHTRGA